MDTLAPARSYPTKWSPPPLIASPALRWSLLIGSLIYLLLAFSSVEVNWARVSEGLQRSARFLAGFFTPDFTSRWGDIQQGMIESLTMTVTSTVAGIA